MYPVCVLKQAFCNSWTKWGQVLYKVSISRVKKSSLLHVVTLKSPVMVFPSKGRILGTCGIRVFLKEVTAEYRFILLKIWEVKFETNWPVPQLVTWINMTTWNQSNIMLSKVVPHIAVFCLVTQSSIAQRDKMAARETNAKVNNNKFHTRTNDDTLCLLLTVWKLPPFPLAWATDKDMPN